MQTETTILEADAGVKFHMEFIYADVDPDTEVETVIDITGYQAVMTFRRDDTDDDPLILTSDPAAGLTITGAQGKIEVDLTAAQTQQLDDDGGHHAWKLDLIAPGDDDASQRFAGQINTKPWP